jgi:multiple sugar transport system permease protein
MAAPADQKVITVGLPTMLIRGDIFFWGALMAGGLLVGLPAAALFGVIIERFIHGLTMAVD